jgi:hypothetical protein
MNSRRAGGEYKVTASVMAQVEALSLDDKKRITSWIVLQHRAGIAVPQIDSDNFDDIKSRRLMSFTERVNRALLSG